MNKNKIKRKKKTHVPLRMNILFFVVFLLFSALIFRLGLMQIVYGEDYKREIQRTEDVTVNNSVPRGKIYDTNGKSIVDNEALYAITYTRDQNTKMEEVLETAQKLSKLITMDTEKLRERDLKDYWILTHSDEAKEKISEEMNRTENKLDDKALYALQLERITKADLATLSDKDLQVAAIYREFTSGYFLTAQTVKNKGVTYEEVARVNENLQNLPGVDTTTDWNRKYSFGETLRSILGNVSSSEEGLPKEMEKYYMARDYSRNDRVGKSYLELQYEDVLHGQKAKVKKVTKSGNIIDTEVITEGQRGKDLVLTIDMDLQQSVEKIIEEELLANKKLSTTKYLDRAFVVMMDPHTGEILTMAGKKFEKDAKTGKSKVSDYSLGTFTSAYEMGSAVKGATVLTGYQTGAITPGTRFYDAPIKIKDTKAKKSWKNFGWLNDVDALKVSSNVYMFRTAINIGKGNYVENGPLSVRPEAFTSMRNYYSQFGLGVRTGIDLPGETVGTKGNEKGAGLLMDFAIGQYDAYTPLQLAQYISTIANGGNRIKPHLVREIREPVIGGNELGPVLDEIQPVVLNKISMKEEWINRVKEGLRKVTQEPGGTGYSYFGSAKYKPAGKTGTAETFYYDLPRPKGTDAPPTMNITFASYAPYDNPEVAMSVVVPRAYQDVKGTHMNLDIAKRVYEAYFDLKEQRNKQNSEENRTTDEQNLQQ